MTRNGPEAAIDCAHTALGSETRGALSHSSDGISGASPCFGSSGFDDMPYAFWTVWLGYTTNVNYIYIYIYIYMYIYIYICIHTYCYIYIYTNNIIYICTHRYDNCFLLVQQYAEPTMIFDVEFSMDGQWFCLANGGPLANANEANGQINSKHWMKTAQAQSWMGQFLDEDQKHIGCKTYHCRDGFLYETYDY